MCNFNQQNFNKLVIVTYTAAEMETEWKKHSLDEVETLPGEKALVSFRTQKLEEVGEVLTPTIAQDQPQVHWTVEDGKFYTVFMIDPDAPSRANPSKREWFHWGVINIPGCDIDKGEVFAPYIGAGPPPNTGGSPKFSYYHIHNKIRCFLIRNVKAHQLDINSN